MTPPSDPWSVTSSPGSLTHRATLTGSTEGITCVDFSTMVRRLVRLGSGVGGAWLRSRDRSGLLCSGRLGPRRLLRQVGPAVAARRVCSQGNGKARTARKQTCQQGAALCWGAGVVV